MRENSFPLKAKVLKALLLNVLGLPQTERADEGPEHQ